MELSTIRIIASICMIALGTFYFLKPVKALRLIHFMNKNYEPKESTVAKYKYGGIAIVALGVYYILVMMELLPMPSFWQV